MVPILRAPSQREKLLINLSTKEERSIKENLITTFNVTNEIGTVDIEQLL